MSTTTSWPNPRDHPDNAHLPNINKPEALIGLTIAFLSIAVTAVCLRLWVRIRDQLWGWDDFFVCFAAAASFAGDIIVCLLPSSGCGLHLWTLDAHHLSQYFQHVYSSNVCYTASATFIKLAILFQYLRLFDEAATSTYTRQYRVARRVTIALIILVSVWGLIFFNLAVFSCNPISKNWNTSLKGTCFGWGSKHPNAFFSLFVSHSASNMSLDILVLLLPLPFLSMLRLAGKSKAGLILFFTVGTTISGVAVGRMVSMTINRAGTVPILDMTYSTPLIYLFSVLEVNFAIIAASIPIFWPVIATLATNKIWVVNEIEVHVEETTRDSFSSSGAIGLSESDGWKDDAKDDFGRRTSRLSFVAKAYDRTKPAPTKHHRNTSSVGRTMGFGTRTSQDSQRELYRAPSNERVSSKASLTRSERDDWFAEANKQNTAGRTTTTVETTQIPFTPINGLKK